MRGGQKGAWPIKGVANQGGVVLGSDIGWSMGVGSEGGVANQRRRGHQERFRGGVKAELRPMGGEGGSEGGVANQGGLAKAARRVERTPVRREGGLIRGVN